MNKSVTPAKNIVAIQDISCYSRCSMTAVWPTLSHFGHIVTPLPTALLSTQTGCYTDFSFLDLTDEMEKIIAHWQRLGLKFDCAFSGFLGSERQIETVSRFIDGFLKEDAFVLVDPVMGDNGKIYQTYTREMCEGMKKLCTKADLITPNITEACILAGCEYDAGIGALQAYKLIDKLLSMGSKPNFTVIITGVSDENGRIGICGKSVKGEAFSHFADATDSFFPGCGDFYAAALLGRMLNGVSAKEAAFAAADFVSGAAAYTNKRGTAPREGLLVEEYGFGR